MSCSAHRIAYQHADADATQRPHLGKFSQELQDVLQDVASKQEMLAKSREDLVIERQRLISSRNQVRAKRLETRDAEAGLMSCLRNLMNDVQQKVPALLLESYNRVDTLRNELGVLEEELLLAERSFAGSEWGFMDEENDFYQFELLDVIENAISDGASPLHDHEQSLMSTEPSLELLELGEASTHATPYPPPSYIPTGDEGVVQSYQHVPPPPPPPPPLPLHISRLHSYEPVVERCNEPPLPAIHPSPQGVSAESSAGPRDYHTVVEELETLRRSFETLRYEQAEGLDAIEHDSASISNPSSIGSEIDNTAQPAAGAVIEQQPFFQILQQISDREIEARRLKNEAMFNDIEHSAITRRYSDPTNFANAAPTPSIFMGRALTETVVPMLSNDSRAKGRLREWLLAQLKEDALQRRMYRNILMHEGLKSPADETWEDRASSYWNIDHASDGEMETIDSYNEDEEYTITRATSHDPSAIPLSLAIGHQANPSSPLHNMHSQMEGKSTISPHREAVMSPITVSPRTRNTIAESLKSGQGLSQDLVLSPDEQTQNPEHNWSFSLSRRSEIDVAKMRVTGKMSEQHDSYFYTSETEEDSLISSVLPIIRQHMLMQSLGYNRKKP